MRIILILILMFSNIVYAQKEITHKISNTERNILVLKKIENDFNIQFFYKKEWLKDIDLHERDYKNDLDSILYYTFKNTSLKYNKYQDKYVILTKSELINLPENATSKQEGARSTKIHLNSYDSLERQLKLEETRIKKIGTPGGKMNRVILSGNVKELFSSENIEGVAVYADDGAVGTTTDKKGNYKVVLDKGYHEIHYQHVAMNPTKRLIEIYSGGKLNIILSQKTMQLEEVRVIGEEEKKEREMGGFVSLKLKEIEELPAFMGELDIIKQSLLLPGIQSVGEADMSFSVRGGRGDQNLILIEGMHTYSYSHFFGFFPNINPNTINKVNLYKSNIPIEYGNRISSVYDLVLKSGDFNKYDVEGSVNYINGNIALSGPIIKDKLSFSISGRSTYSDYIFDKIDITEFKNSSASFYDLQSKLYYRLNNKTTFSLFYYQSFDDFSLREDTTYNFFNRIGSLNYNSVYNEKTKISAVLGYTSFESKTDQLGEMEYASTRKQKIEDWKLNIKVDRVVNSRHNVSVGTELLYQVLNPWSLNGYGESSVISPMVLDSDKALLSSVFLNDKFKLSDQITVDAGLRYLAQFSIGERETYTYEDNKIHEDFIIDSSLTSNFYFTDHGLDVRLSATYKIQENQNLNVGYNRNNQFIHLMTNSQGVTPTDSWQLGNKHLKPQIGNQFSLGYNIDFLNKQYYFATDIYYKKIKNLKDFINGSNFEYNKHPETEIVEGVGKMYGIEFLFKKNAGRISGFMSYTYSRAFIKSNTDLVKKVINDGEYYSASNDKPHNLSVVINLKPTRRLTLSNTFNYSTGAPITLPVSKMYFFNDYSIIYSDRNEYRMPDYYRWDISLTFKGSLKKKRYHSQWVLSVYNVTARKNAYSIYYDIDNGNIQGYKLSIIGEPVPTLTYKFSF